MACRPDSFTPNPVFSFGFPGILGVLPSTQEVKAVFPALSSTVIPHAQEIKFRRGDSFDIDIQIQDDRDPPSEVDASNSVLRFGAKPGYGQYNVSTPSLVYGNDGLQIYKRSYDELEIEQVNPSNGQFKIHIKKSDTVEHPAIPMVWDLELTIPTSQLSAPGTVIVQNGDPIIQGIGTNFGDDGLTAGDIIVIEGRRIMIDTVHSETSIETDFTGWSGGTGLSYELYVSQSRVIASGHWTCLADVVI